VVYFIVRLWRLTFLPIFADEAIYLRWSQLVMTDAPRYLFFALNDGKTPLQIWLNIPFLVLMKDPLAAGRLLSVLVGWGQMVVVWMIGKKMKWGKMAQTVGLGASIMLPWWWFNQRLALMDTLLTFWLALLIYFLLEVRREDGWRVKKIIAATACFGLALLTKIPAILFLPTIVLLTFNFKDWRRSLIKILVISGGGMVMLASLKYLSESFSRLFSRGGDFLGTGGVMSNLWIHSREVMVMNSKYLTLGLVALLLVQMVYMGSKKNKEWWLLVLSGLGFALPIILFGRGDVYPRYYLPSVLPLMLAVLGGIDKMWRDKKWPLGKTIVKGCLVVGLAQSVIFMRNSYSELAGLDLTADDQRQYLDEWSSGFGILEVLGAAQGRASENKRILLISEGDFGTPTDGFNLYLFARKDDRVGVEGIWWQVESIPQTALERAANEYDEAWLVVNSHRMMMEMEEEKLIMEIARPRERAASLQVWRIM
ncbi:glycosyltransferase family 39 protein, partial [Microgenomates group bacterium]|nr:glycosyltransferase family 39 protein [Microgenomates group bacterium]